MGLEVFERGTLPPWAPVRQALDATDVGDVASAVAAEFARPRTGDRIRSGQSVAITAGSRGIDKIAEVLTATASEIKRRGADPFIVPAMGSHGGATAEGQVQLLAHYGVTEERVGCPIRASMETVQLGEVEGGVPVWFDRHAARADATIPVGRVKPHTDFQGPVESGLMKMLAIGLGKQKGADYFHAQGFVEFHHLIPAVAQFTLSQVNIPFGLALIENGYGLLSQIEAIPANEIWDRERALLTIARERMGRLPGERIDVLILDAIGKDISGAGADPNVINRDLTGLVAGGEAPLLPRIQRIVIRDLTDDTEGNATGIGLGDVVLRRAVDKIDTVATYMNVITSKGTAAGRIPMTIETDRQAIAIAIATCLKTESETARIARISDTKHVEHLWVSEPLLAEVLATGRVEQLGELRPIAFDEHGMLCD